MRWSEPSVGEKDRLGGKVSCKEGNGIAFCARPALVSRGLPERRQCVILVSWRYISDLWDQDTILFVTVVVSMLVTRPMCSGDLEMGVSVSPFQSCRTFSGS